MAEKPKVLVFAGSTREGSHNKKLARNAADLISDAEVRIIDLKDYPMPLYDADLEEKSGLPENAVKFREVIDWADALIIATPEYNNSVTAVLKNAIDWASRPPRNVFKGKVVLPIAASIGGFGGLRSIMHLRDILRPLESFVTTDQITVSHADDAFDENDKLKDEETLDDLKEACDALIRITLALKKGV